MIATAAWRETSILFGVTIALFVLKERVGKARMAGAALIAGGAACSSCCARKLAATLQSAHTPFI